VADPFTVDNGQLTPTLKAKRRVIAGLYAQRVEQVYREAEQETEGGGE
jgi:long-subunit acyl-CoA synthetase (AMP-forming)